MCLVIIVNIQIVVRKRFEVLWSTSLSNIFIYMYLYLYIDRCVCLVPRMYVYVCMYLWVCIYVDLWISLYIFYIHIYIIYIHKYIYIYYLLITIFNICQLVCINLYQPFGIKYIHLDMTSQMWLNKGEFPFYLIWSLLIPCKLITPL